MADQNRPIPWNFGERESGLPLSPYTYDDVDQRFRTRFVLLLDDFFGQESGLRAHPPNIYRTEGAWEYLCEWLARDLGDLRFVQNNDRRNSLAKYFLSSQTLTRDLLSALVVHPASEL
jgi:hypothetical protein